MKPILRTLLGVALAVCTVAIAADVRAADRKKDKSATAERTVPRVRFTGDPFAQLASAIFAETLQDMRNKIEDGSNERFPQGFFHTSTEPEGVPQYYNDMWSRDCGRGLIELSRLGFADDARKIARYMLAHITHGNHWDREIHHPTNRVELDGNALILSGVCAAWRVNGMKEDLGSEFCRAIEPVVAWVDSMMRVSTYRGLLPSMSELSGNPSTEYPVYGTFGNYGIYAVMSQIADMAQACGESGLAGRAEEIRSRMEMALGQLVSDGRFSYAPEGCWFNGIDGRDGRAYDISEWDGTSWPIWHWTRQLPYILDYDRGMSEIDGTFACTHAASYELLRHWMARGEYFRKYGFVSNTGWTGMGGRHDETMCGYGQGFFTQAALMADDVNTYGKCLEGVARLGYDGGVIEQMSYEKNPFVMHECFNFENYEKGLDHTFGVHSEGRREIMENPGDEGNLVQEAEVLKAFAMVVGMQCREGRLEIKPRLPWLWDTMECRDWPVVDALGRMHRIDFVIRHDRWLRSCTVELHGIGGFEGTDLRIGPFPRQLKNPRNFEMELIGNASWIWVRDIRGNEYSATVEL